MPIEMRMWRIDGDQPRSLESSSLPAERELHEFLARDPSLLGERLLVIGSEVTTPYGKRIDLLAIDADGDLHVLELKRDKTPREVVAQLLDYATWVTDLSFEEIKNIAETHLDTSLDEAFTEVFGDTLPDELNTSLHLTIVASALDNSSERIVTYLRSFGVPINAVFFSYLEDDERRYLARSWFASDDEEQPHSSASKRRSKQAPWNGTDWYVSFGGHRMWEDARRFGFISAGGGKFYTQTIRNLPVGARVWVNVPGTGYVGVGTTTVPAQRSAEAMIDIEGESVRLADQDLLTSYDSRDGADDDDIEWVVPVTWSDTRSETDAFWEKGMFASQHSACKLRHELTLERLTSHFTVDEDRS